MKKIFAFLLISLFAVSCTESLNKYPLDKLSDADFFSNEDGLRAYSNAFYTVFPGPSSLDNACLCCLDMADTYFGNTRLDVVDGTRIPAPTGVGDWNWDKLRDINTLLENLKQCKDDKVRKEYEGLARFFRAFFYFEKVKRFGNVPWYETQLGSDDEALYKTQDKRTTVIDNVILDLDCAIAQLPRTKSIYTVTAWTAMALKSRVCLFEGTFEKYHNIDQEHATKLLNLCAEVSALFMSDSGYTLYSTNSPETDYANLFTANNYAGSPTTTEVVLARNYSSTYGTLHRLHALLLTSGEHANGMSRKAVATYLNRDGSRFTDKADWEKTIFIDEMKDRDPRLAQSIRYPGYHRIGNEKTIAPDLQNCVSGYQPTKFLMTEDKDVHGQSDCDIILFRAGEVLLNYAEAKAELGTLTQEDADKTINALRKRAGLTGGMLDVENVTADPFLTDAKWGGYTHVTSPVILEVRRERTCELNQEGFRYFDLMRWKEGKALCAPLYGMYFPGPGEYDLDGNGTIDVCLYIDNKPSSKATAFFKIDSDIFLSEGNSGMIDKYKNNVPAQWNEDRDYLYPLPLQELRLEGTHLVQNPYWDDGKGTN